MPLQEIFSVGGQCWLAKLLQQLRSSEFYLFDWVATTPMVVAHCIDDNFAKLTDPKEMSKGNLKGERCHHPFYERYAAKALAAELEFIGMGEDKLHILFDSIGMGEDKLQMFQHEARHKEDFSTTLKRRAGRFRRSLSGEHWKVIVYGCAVPWKAWRAMNNGAEQVLGDELIRLFKTLKTSAVANFVLVGLIVITEVPDEEHVEGNCFNLLQPEWSYSCDCPRAFLHTVPFHSALGGAKFVGNDAKYECDGLLALLREYYEQTGWNQFMCPNFRHPYWANRRLRITTWDWPTFQPIRVGSVVMILVDQSPPGGSGYLIACEGTQATVLYVGSTESDDKDWLYAVTQKDIGWVKNTQVGVPKRSAVPTQDESCRKRRLSDDTSRSVTTVITNGSDTSVPEGAIYCNNWVTRSLWSGDVDGPIVLADSTCMLNGVERFDLTYKLLQGSVVGKYGSHLGDPDFKPFKQFVRAKLQQERPDRRLRVGYVPAWACHPRHEYPTHAHHQKNALCSYSHADFIATPSLMALSDKCRQQTCSHLFKAKGCHCTENGRKWLMCFLLRFAADHNLPFIFCIGWNSGDPQFEYEEQVALVDSFVRT